jgi:predicted nucleic acid-binding Zn ribbon protein
MKLKREGGHTLKEAIGEFMKSYHLDEKLLQKQLILAWPKVTGRMVANHTEKLTIRKKVLYVKLDSAALRNELSFSREKILKALNNSVRAEVITDIIIH